MNLGAFQRLHTFSVGAVAEALFRNRLAAQPNRWHAEAQNDATL